MGAEAQISRAELHFWEEPCISGKEGSGTVFFTGCGLGCVYCQNSDISRGQRGIEKTPRELAGIYIELQGRGANNINLVTASHFLPHVVESVSIGRKNGLTVPVVYNCGGYESPEKIKKLSGVVDVYLPDFKYADERGAAELSHAPDYPVAALAAIDQMVAQQPKCVFDERGIIQKGVIIRHLLLPGRVIQSKMAIKRIYERYGDNVYISIMNQYTPMPNQRGELCRKVTAAEYKSLILYAAELGLKNAYIQSEDASGEEYIPEFYKE